MKNFCLNGLNNGMLKASKVYSNIIYNPTPATPKGSYNHRYQIFYKSAIPSGLGDGVVFCLYTYQIFYRFEIPSGLDDDVRLRVYTYQIFHESAIPSGLDGAVISEQEAIKH
ncbi:MAG: hypothetical protein KatS3mg027_2119 [Bacteroidia bacterium]|nr:MAG: hypothetical protein KatS3mg027_2119 [Bacteroidia bacterium]